MRPSLFAAFLVGLAAAACGDAEGPSGSGFTCTIEYISETGGPTVETEEKDFSDSPTVEEAVEDCTEYARSRYNETRKSHTCLCSN